jgi:hypothetical protein
MEATISGFEVEGDWEEVVKHGERVTRALRESGVLNDGGPEDVDGNAAFEEWDEWRPKAHEDLDAEMNEKTAEQASVSEADDVPEEAEVDDLPEAETLVREADDPAEDDEGLGDLVSALARGLGSLADSAESASRQALQSAEEVVYKNVMTQLGPYYFDNGLVSANIRRTDDGDVELFVFEINVNDDDLKEEVRDRLEGYDAAEDEEMAVSVAAEDDPGDVEVEDLDLDGGADEADPSS